MLTYIHNFSNYISQLEAFTLVLLDSCITEGYTCCECHLTHCVMQGAPYQSELACRSIDDTACTDLYWYIDTWYTGKYQCFGE